VLHEALTARADPLHLALVFGFSHTTASRYTLMACDLLADHQPAGAVSCEPDEVPELSAGLFRDLAGEKILPLISSASWRTLATLGLVLALSRVRR
jgi:hypothetical protein